jgi:hypothetical protein
MSREHGGGPPTSSILANRELSTGRQLVRGRSGRVEAEWKQQREKPVVGMLQLCGRLWQQSPQERALATTGPPTPSARRAKNSQAKRLRPIPLI